MKVSKRVKRNPHGDNELDYKRFFSDDNSDQKEEMEQSKAQK